MLWQWLAVISQLCIATCSANQVETCTVSDYPFCNSKRFNIVPTFQVGDVHRNNPRLYLARNRIEKVQRDAFITAGQNVRFINIGHNNISNVEPNAFTRINETLEILWIGKNSLTRVLPHFFVNLNKLTRLDLSHNLLTSVDNSFVGLHSLTQLFLDNNRLQSLPEYLIREREDCETCISTRLPRQFIISLRHNNLRYVPVCSIQRLRQANPSSQAYISSLVDNGLYCDCMDVKWSETYLLDYLSPPDPVGGNNVCNLSPSALVNAVPLRDLLSRLNHTELCHSKLNISSINCNGAHLELSPLPAPLTPTLKFGVDTDTSLVRQYNIVIAATDGTHRIASVVGPGESSYSYVVNESIRPNTDYTICVVPSANMEGEGSGSLVWFGKACRSYHAAAASTAHLDGAANTDVWHYVLAALPVIFFIGGVVAVHRRKISKTKNDHQEEAEKEAKTSSHKLAHRADQSGMDILLEQIKNYEMSSMPRVATAEFLPNTSHHSGAVSSLYASTSRYSGAVSSHYANASHYSGAVSSIYASTDSRLSMARTIGSRREMSRRKVSHREYELGLWRV